MQAVVRAFVGNDRCSLLQKNITGARQLSQKTPKAAVKVMRISAPPKGTVYNYSMQTLNSAELAKKELYREMAKVSPGRAGQSGFMLQTVTALSWPHELFTHTGGQQTSSVQMGATS